MSLIGKYFSQSFVQQGHSDLSLILTIGYATYAFGNMSILCELGQRLSDAFEEVGDEIEAFEWDLFPHEIQKLLPVMMMVGQQPVTLECFGSTSGTRETFKKVCLSIFTTKTFIELLILSSGGQQRVLLFYGAAAIHEMKLTCSTFSMKLTFIL